MLRLQASCLVLMTWVVTSPSVVEVLRTVREVTDNRKPREIVQVIGQEKSFVVRIAHLRNRNLRATHRIEIVHRVHARETT
jgi:hypothetical protein